APLPQERGEISPLPQERGEISPLPQERGEISPLPQERGEISPRPVGEGWVRAIQKIDIFHYTYAILHHPHYRQKYEQNLKRDFPRLPLHDDFWQWANWGKQLIELHLNYETIEPYPLQRIDLPLKPGTVNKPKLKPDKTKGAIALDGITTIQGIPAIAWDYKLGNRSAIEWVLDQHKEKKPKDPTIREKFNTYKFADYKETVIDLLMRVCTVSVQTQTIINQMPTPKPSKPL
ncbi:type ISP restriction/modification enzyme, partial [Spirulina subsalsa]|uniref:type ISP restriction/modification enzyme n=1 Tax=Spirulina subsalsa TaxID=54311 RepID=UPI003A8E9884